VNKYESRYSSWVDFERVGKVVHKIGKLTVKEEPEVMLFALKFEIYSVQKACKEVGIDLVSEAEVDAELKRILVDTEEAKKMDVLFDSVKKMVGKK